jgi:DNA primase
MPDDFAQRVKAQADIVKIVGDYVRLRKAGAQNWSGLCPFHSEKSPSFSVHASRQFFHCFGCGVSGDIFSFIQKIENVSFPESVKVVAGKAGIPLPKREFTSPEEAAEHRERARLIELHEQASAWFEEQLKTAEGAQARSYLAGRGMTDEGIQRFHIGYAPDSSSALREHLQRLAPAEAVKSGELARLLRLAGLFTSKEQEDEAGNLKSGPLYPRFRKRITFPIANESGRVIAFTARALDSGDKAGPKYLNSPETPLYAKGHVLFNLHNARQPIRQIDFALLVEGQMDCISVSLAGIGNVLATSGTAFTEAQVRLLGRYTKRVIVNFDPDTAGANAAEKSIALLTEEGFDVRVVSLEDGLDPDRYVRERGVAAYTAAVRGARRYTDYLLDRAQQMHPPTSAQGKLDALNYLLPHIRRMPHELAREDFAMTAAQRLGIDSALMRDEWRKAATSRSQTPMGSAKLVPTDAEKQLLRALSGKPESMAFLAVAAALDRYPERFAGLVAERVLRLLRDREGDGDAMLALEEEIDRSMLAQALWHESSSVDAAEVEASLQALERTAMQRELHGLKAQLDTAHSKGEEDLYITLATRKQAIERALREL